MPYVERVTKDRKYDRDREVLTSRYKRKGISRGDKVKTNKRRAGESKHQTGREKVKDTHKCELWIWGLPFSA